MKTQQTTTSQPITLATQSVPVTDLLTPISYAVAAAILLSAIAAFLRTLFDMGKK